MSFAKRAGAGMGDLLTDARSLSLLVAAANQPGGIAGWAQAQLRAFSQLPGDVQTMQAQVNQIAALLTGVQTGGSAMANLDQASSQLANITANYGSVQLQVQAAMFDLAPALSSASMTATDWISVVSNSGAVLSAFSGMNDLLSARDAARQSIQLVLQDGSVPANLRAQMGQVIAATTGQKTNWMAVGILGGALYVVYRTLRKVI